MRVKSRNADPLLFLFPKLRCTEAGLILPSIKSNISGGESGVGALKLWLLDE